MVVGRTHSSRLYTRGLPQCLAAWATPQDSSQHGTLPIRASKWERKKEHRRQKPQSFGNLTWKQHLSEPEIQPTIKGVNYPRTWIPGDRDHCGAIVEAAHHSLHGTFLFTYLFFKFSYCWHYYRHIFIMIIGKKKKPCDYSRNQA